jgi:hypothetical protein
MQLSQYAAGLRLDDGAPLKRSCEMSVGQTSPKRIVGVEEHFLLPDLLGRIPEIAARERVRRSGAVSAA